MSLLKLSLGAMLATTAYGMGATDIDYGTSVRHGSDSSNPGWIATQLNSNKPDCGGSVISVGSDHFWILTAAHCNAGLTDWMVGMSSTGGDHSVAWNAPGRYESTQQILHSNTDADYFHDDIMLMKMSCGSSVYPCPTIVASMGSYCPSSGTLSISGFGLTESGNRPDGGNMQSGTIPVHACNEKYDEVFGAGTWEWVESNLGALASNIICAGSPDGGDAGQGDSGGPLHSGNTVYGLVSSEIDASAGTMYTCVSAYYDWITNKIGGADNLGLPATDSVGEEANEAFEEEQEAEEEEEVLEEIVGGTTVIGTMKDSYGDGWNGGSLRCGSASAFTLGSGSTGEVNVPVGVTCEWDFASGQYPGEASFECGGDTHNVAGGSFSCGAAAAAPPAIEEEVEAVEEAVEEAAEEAEEAAEEAGVNAGNNCEVTVTFKDSYGDGWNGGSVTCGGQEYTLANGGEGSMTLASGDCTFNFSSGQYPAEASVECGSTYTPSDGSFSCGGVCAGAAPVDNSEAEAIAAAEAAAAAAEAAAAAAAAQLAEDAAAAAASEAAYAAAQLAAQEAAAAAAAAEAAAETVVATGGCGGATLVDSYGDGWNGGRVLCTDSGEHVLNSGSSTTASLCGECYFDWANGQYAEEASVTCDSGTTYGDGNRNASFMCGAAAESANSASESAAAAEEAAEEAAEVAPASAQQASGGCSDVAGWDDGYGDTCSGYASNTSWCGTYATLEGAGGLKPGEACCACGGGN